MIILTTTTPEYAQIETIRSYMRIPEKAYRWKILIILLFDLFLVSIYIYGHYITEVTGNIYIDTSNSNFFYLLQQTIYSISGEDNILHLIFILIIYILTFFVLPLLVYMVIKHVIPRVFEKILTLCKVINPFHHEKYSDMKKMSIIRRKERKEAKEKARKISKVQRFLSFKDSSWGIFITRYIAFSHWIAHFAFLRSEESHIYLAERNETFMYKVIVGVYILNLIIFWLLRKEPERSQYIAKEKMCYSFSYYLEPYRRASLSPLEKEAFSENFSTIVRCEKIRLPAYYRYGIYNRQRLIYSVQLYVEDLITGMSYLLAYETDSKYNYWKPVKSQRDQIFDNQIKHFSL